MAKDYLYTNGILAAKEKELFLDKLIPYTEKTKSDFVRMLSENNFGAGSENDDIDTLISRELLLLDKFILEYAPNENIKNYLLSSRDFHNLKAVIKEQLLGVETETLFAPFGLYTADELRTAVKSGDYSTLNKGMQDALNILFVGKRKKKDVCPFPIEKFDLPNYSVPKFNLPNGKRLNLTVQEEILTGEHIGATVNRAYYKHLLSVTKHTILQTIAKKEIDYLNIITTYRCRDEKQVESQFVPGGTVSLSECLSVFRGERITVKDDEMTVLIKTCIDAKENKRPFSVAEKMYEQIEFNFFYSHRFELKKIEPFLYYVIRKRLDCINIRIIYISLELRMQPLVIKKRLRAL